MSQTPVLLETSFVHAIAIIAASDELPKQTRRHWTTSLRQIAKALDSGAKASILFSGQITNRIYQATGLRITVHQFRHAAGALILQSRPGEYELVRQLLGHRNVQTTINAYIGLENIHASEIFSKIVRQYLDDELVAAE
jgi:integrase